MTEADVETIIQRAREKKILYERQRKLAEAQERRKSNCALIPEKCTEERKTS